MSGKGLWLLLLWCGMVDRTFAVVSHDSATVTERLQGIQQRLPREGEADKEAYDKVSCWCQKQVAEESRSISNARQDLTTLMSDIEARTAEHAQLAEELHTHQAELKSNQQALDSVGALRAREADQYAADEQEHKQSLNTIDGALKALDHSSPGHALALDSVDSIVARMRRRLGATSLGEGLFLQSAKHRRGETSPAVVSGMLKRMRSTFSAELEDLRTNELRASARHAELSAAKRKEMSALDKLVADKKGRAASIQLLLAHKTKQRTIAEMLLNAHSDLLAAEKDMCQRNDHSFDIRQQERQAELVALASLQADLVVPKLLQRSANFREPSGGVEMVCDVVCSIGEGSWHNKVDAVCEMARAGKHQDAADAVEALEDELSTKQQAIASEHDACLRSARDAAEEATGAAQSDAAREGFIRSDLAQADSQIADVLAQGSRTQEAKAVLSRDLAAQRDMLLKMQADTAKDIDVLRHVARSSAVHDVAGAGQKVAEIQRHAERLMAMASVETGAADGAPKVARLIDAVARASAKQLIPLRLMRADAEEAAVAADEDVEARAHSSLKVPACNAAMLASQAKELGSCAAQLGRAAQALAYEVLR